MTKSNKFSPEVRECAVRVVQDYRGEYPSLRATFESIAPKIGCVPQTRNEWVKRVEVVTTAAAQRVKELEREVKELHRANEILKLASALLPKRSSAANLSTERLHRPAP